MVHLTGSQLQRDSRTVPLRAADDPYAPLGTLHAVKPGTFRAVCGTEVNYVWKDIPWATPARLGCERCTDCTAAAPPGAEPPGQV
jgi:hypothetical protein